MTLELGNPMAYRAEGTELMVTVAPGASEVMPAMVAKPAVHPVDARRVRLAVGLTILLAVIDLVLYLPRLI